MHNDQHQSSNGLLASCFVLSIVQVDDPDKIPLFHSKVAVYRLKGNQGILPGAQLTVFGACYVILKLKQSSFMKPGLVNKWCKLIHTIILPQPNWFPPTLYLAEQIIGVPSPSQFEYHACPAELCCWLPLPRSQWEQHKDDRCDHGKRFNAIKTPTGRLVLQPVKVMQGMLTNAARGARH
jgi:hypothetical protein